MGSCRGALVSTRLQKGAAGDGSVCWCDLRSVIDEVVVTSVVPLPPLAVLSPWLPAMASVSAPTPHPSRSPLHSHHHRGFGVCEVGWGGGGWDRPDLAGVTTPVNTPHHSDTVSISSQRALGGLTHDACSPVHVVGRSRVRGPLLVNRRPGKTSIRRSSAIPRQK